MKEEGGILLPLHEDLLNLIDRFSDSMNEISECISAMRAIGDDATDHEKYVLVTTLANVFEEGSEIGNKIKQNMYIAACELRRSTEGYRDAG